MIPFTKMHGIGNDFVMVDTLRSPLVGKDLAGLSRRMCDRRFGIGSDGLILAERGEAAPFRMRMFNPDGTESEMCGNGIRCLAKLLHGHGHARSPEIAIETGAGILRVKIQADGSVQVEMGFARLQRADIPVSGDPSSDFVSQPVDIGEVRLLGTAVSMGNPHVVFFVDDVQATPVERWGPLFERHSLFPARINVHFAQVVDRSHVIQRTWERGVGITLACGTGACACTAAAGLNGLCDRTVEVSLPGGSLAIEYLKDGGVLMSGPAETVFEGEWIAD